MGRLQYISSTNGTFSITSSTWLNQIRNDCVIEYKFLSTSRTDVLDFGAVISTGFLPTLTNGMILKYALGQAYLQWYNGTRTTISTSRYTLNTPHILTLSGSEYKWDGETIASVSNIQTVNNPKFKPTINGNFYYFKVKKNGTDFINLVPWERNGVLYIKDLVSNTEWRIGGSWTAGPAYRDDSNVVPINKYKLYTSNIQKTYNGSNHINKMYIGNDLVYRALPTTTPAPSCGSGIPSDEVWYKASQVTYPYRPYYLNNSWFNCDIDGTGSDNYIISNTYDSTDGWYKIKWSCDFVKSCGSGWYTKSGITEVIYPDCFKGEDAENWNQCTGITKITYGNSVTYLDQGACPPNVTDIYMYTTTPPDMNPGQDPRGDYFRLHNSNIPLTLHLPYGSDWSGVTLPSEVTVVYDLCV